VFGNVIVIRDLSADDQTARTLSIKVRPIMYIILYEITYIYNTSGQYNIDSIIYLLLVGVIL
jgi:hypothetical protein